MIDDFDDDIADEPIRAIITDVDDCPYLEGREWRNCVVDATPLSPAVHERLLDQNFRRMGHWLYRPICDECSECRSLRVPADAFVASRSQRRVRRRNNDVRLEIGRAVYSDDKRDLLERYLAGRHEGPMTAEAEPTREFMFGSPFDTLGFSYFVDDRLVGYGLVDETPNVVSSLYFFFDPDESARSLGIYSALCEIDYAAQRGRQWYHPGFYVEGCRTMTYKRQFRPNEIMGQKGWRPLDPPPTSGRRTKGSAAEASRNQPGGRP